MNDKNYIIRFLATAAFILPLFLTSCSDNDYHYPSVKQEFLTATSTAKGIITEVVTDEKEVLPVTKDGSRLNIKKDTVLRIVTNYEKHPEGVVLYGSILALSNIPIPAADFKEEIKRDPANMVSIWKGYQYLNMILEIKAQKGKHTMRFVEESVQENQGTKEVVISLFHDAHSDLEAYFQRVYASIPLSSYLTADTQHLHICLKLHTYKEGVKEFNFTY